MATQRRDFWWVAGLLEGEGCFLLVTTKCKGHVYYHPRIDLAMTDEDVVARAAKILGGTYRRRKYKPKGKRLPVFKCSIYSKNALQWMHRLLPLMGKRRQEKLLAIFKLRDTVRRKPWGQRHKEGT